MQTETDDRDSIRTLTNKDSWESQTPTPPLGVITIKYGRWASKDVHHFCGYEDAISLSKNNTNVSVLKVC